MRKFGREQDLANCFDLLKMGRVRVGAIMRSAVRTGYTKLRSLNLTL